MDCLERLGEGALQQASADIPEELPDVCGLLQEQKPGANQELLPQHPEEASERAGAHSVT